MKKVGITLIIHGDYYDKARIVRTEGINTQRFNGHDLMYAYQDSTIIIGIAIKYGYYIESFTVKSPSKNYMKNVAGFANGNKNGIAYDTDNEYLSFHTICISDSEMVLDIQVAKIKHEDHKITLDIPRESNSIWEVLNHPNKMVPPGEQVTIRVQIEGKKFSFITLRESQSSRDVKTSSNVYYDDNNKPSHVDILFIMPCDNVDGMISIYKEDNMKNIFVNEELRKLMSFYTGIDADRFDHVKSEPGAVVGFKVDTAERYKLSIFSGGSEVSFTTEKVSETVDDFRFTMPNGDVSIMYETDKGFNKGLSTEVFTEKGSEKFWIRKEITKGQGSILIDHNDKGSSYLPIDEEMEYGSNVRFHAIPGNGYQINTLGIKVTTVDNRVIHLDNNFIEKNGNVELSSEFIMPPSDVLIQAAFEENPEQEKSALSAAEQIIEGTIDAFTDPWTKENEKISEYHGVVNGENKVIYVNDKGPGITVVDSKYGTKLYNTAKPGDIVTIKTYPMEGYINNLTQITDIMGNPMSIQFVEREEYVVSDVLAFVMPDESIIVNTYYSSLIPVLGNPSGNISNLVDWFEIPDDLARSLSEDLTKMSIRQKMLDEYILDEAKYAAAEKLLIPIVQSVEAKKVIITRQYVPIQYRSEAYQWNYDGYEIDGNKVQILKVEG